MLKSGFIADLVRNEKPVTAIQQNVSDASFVSIIINNYNYGRFLAMAIDSVLAQDYSSYELIVVDDGSTDDSREVIGRYLGRLLPVLKPNGGQGSALNEGFAHSNGEIVLFLDADDFLLPGALSVICGPFVDPDVVQLVAPVRLVDATGQPTGVIDPQRPMSADGVRTQTLRFGPLSGRPIAATSGNAWRRSFLEQVLPMPTEPFRILADVYLRLLAPLYGRHAVMSEPFAAYRVHGNNNYYTNRTTLRTLNTLRADYSWNEIQGELLLEHAERLGLRVDPTGWRLRDWRQEVRRYLIWLLDGTSTDFPRRLSVLRAAVRDPKARFTSKVPLLSLLALLVIAPPKWAMPLGQKLLWRRGGGSLSPASMAAQFGRPFG